MTATVVLRPALPPDRAAIDRLLRGAGLRSEGEQLPIEVFVVAEAGSSIVGAVALEARGDAGLVRSLAVDLAWRGRGLGDRLVAHLLAIAAQQDLAKLWLLTTTASAFFARWGFAKARRDEAPAAIATHRQFAAECPASATCMALALPRGDSAIDVDHERESPTRRCGERAASEGAAEAGPSRVNAARPRPARARSRGRRRGSSPRR